MRKRALEANHFLPNPHHEQNSADPGKSRQFPRTEGEVEDYLPEVINQSPAAPSGFANDARP
jgi:hypothetical protein